MNFKAGWELACYILLVHDNVTGWRRALMSFTDRLGFTVAQAVAAWLLVFLIGGAAGVVAMLLCHYLLTFGGEDSANKHGISKVSATDWAGSPLSPTCSCTLATNYSLVFTNRALIRRF